MQLFFDHRNKLAQFRVFLSSTAYDLHLVRGHLRDYLSSAGHQPVLSDYNDILYDPKQHTVQSCVQELKSCDAVVLIIGSRFGSIASPEFVKELTATTEDIDAFTKSLNVSVTQLEALSAFNQEIPVFAFVDANVMSDFRVYQSNADSEFAAQISYPSIPDQTTAEFIFEFISFIQQRASGNAIFTFEKISDIEAALSKQWSSLLQRLLSTERASQQQSSLLAEISEQILDLKSAVISSIDSPEVRDIARGILNYRALIDILRSLNVPGDKITNCDHLSWSDLLRSEGISAAVEKKQTKNLLNGIALQFDSGDLAQFRFPVRRFWDLAEDWTTFNSLPIESRRLIYETLREQMRPQQLARRVTADNWDLSEYDVIASFANDTRSDQLFPAST